MATALQLQEFDPKAKRPAFIPYDVNNLQDWAKGVSRDTYNASDAYRNKTRPQWSQALKAGEAGILDDVKGDSTLIPEVQSEAVRAGLGSALSSFGDETKLTPDSAASARVSTSLFGTANALNQQMRENRYRALTVGSQLFPERQIGMSGTDAATVVGANTLGQNSWNDANYHDTLENERLNWRVQAENQRAQVQQGNVDAAASAQEKGANQQAMIQGGAAIAGVAVLAIAL